MNERYPRVRHFSDIEGSSFLCLRESVRICFYMRRSHAEFAQAVLRSLDLYRKAVGLESLRWYPDDEGWWHELDKKSWALHERKLMDSQGAIVDLCESDGPTTGYAFTYWGRDLSSPLFVRDPEAVCAVSFLLPTEFLEAHGPGRVRELALELAKDLPFNSGHAGLCFHYDTGSLLGTNERVRELCFRHPGFDIPSRDSPETSIGTRVNGVHWLTFLGQPVLGELGGAAGLRSRLHTPGTTVQDMEGDRAVVTLGPWPGAGDTERGDTLPAYRELARVLEPWVYHRRFPFAGFTEGETRRWERRFLD